ncbi:SurA N-terminal domain-containing protein [Thermosulfurimonas sp. F29]|uniref:SurA N-terminal domain-containing protein n=1 Tax=Thermosulfurimonas sp. F29 TaxID=2867247 RepID=UPI001C8372C0|nr:SurA N-terminal domain-containing protein [Thermosulfurimonas sp. F29]MBX6422192.1 SurA N-terminal domain-containing protein [Thermosulfurimonas sp. F29]
MLDFLRKGAQSTAVKILFAVIILVFVFWGVGTFRASRVDVLARVNGKPITVREYQLLYEFRYRQLRQMFGNRVDEDFLKNMHFREQVLEELIKRRLLEEAADRLGLSVHPREVQWAIAQIPAFQEGGRFSFRRYRAVLRDLGILPRDFEENVRADLLEARIRHFLTATIFAPETEVRERYAFENQVLRIRYASLPYATCERGLKVTEEELRDYYRKHREEYRTEPRVQVAYVFFPYARYRGKIKVSEEELKAYYESEKDRFFEPERRRVRMILIKAEPGKKAAALKKAEALAEKIKTLTDFERMARRYSQDRATAKLGGDLGVVKPGELFKAADQAVFSAEEGRVVGPVEGPQGYYLFYVQKILPAGTRPFREVKTELEKELLRRKVHEAAYEAADDLYQKAVLSGSLPEAAAKAGLKVKEVSFTRKKPPEILSGKELLEAVFSLEEGEISSPVEAGGGVILFQVEKKEPSRIMTFSEARRFVRRDLIREKAAERCRKRASELLKELSGKKSLSEAAHRGFKVVERTLKRNELFSGEIPRAVARALGGRTDPGLLDRPACDGEACYLVQLAEVRPADFSNWDEERTVLFHVLTQEKRAAYYRAWYRDLRRRAKIKLYKELPK